MRLFKLGLAIFSIFAVVVLNGCATPANYQNMIVKPTSEIKPNPKLKGAVVVTGVSGGKKTNPLWSSQVDSGAFKQALERSLNEFGYLSNSSNKARYQLDADLLSINQPFVAYTINIDSKVGYKMLDTKTKATKEYVVKSSATATVSEKFVFNDRLTLANERTIKENIKGFLKKLSSY